jgi:hypothetical protein
MRSTFLFAILGSCALALAGCGGDTACQSGPKYGTQCYSLTDVRSGPGQRPPSVSEPPQWWNGPPPAARYGASQAKPAPTPPPPPPSTYPMLKRETDAGD